MLCFIVVGLQNISIIQFLLNNVNFIQTKKCKSIKRFVNENIQE